MRGRCTQRQRALPPARGSAPDRFVQHRARVRLRGPPTHVERVPRALADDRNGQRCLTELAQLHPWPPDIPAFPGPPGVPSFPTLPASAPGIGLRAERGGVVGPRPRPRPAQFAEFTGGLQRRFGLNPSPPSGTVPAPALLREPPRQSDKAWSVPLQVSGGCCS